MSTDDPARLSLGKLSGALLVLLIVGLAFVGGSSLFDGVTMRNPTEAMVAGAVLSQVPATLQRFAVSGLSYAAAEPAADGRRNAELTLALREPLYAPADFAAKALERGDDPVAFAAALERRKKLAAAAAPKIPDATAPPPLYAVAKPAGTPFSLRVTFQAAKVPRRWSLQACYFVWRGQRDWQVTDLGWADVPADIAALRRRGELGGSVVFFGEESGDRLLDHYGQERRAFVDAVGDQEWKMIERAADAAIRAEVAPALKPPGAFAVTGTKVLRPSPAPPLGNGPHRLEAGVMIEQTVELFRAVAADALPAGPRGVIAAFAGARKDAEEFQLAVGLTPAAAPVFYASASPARARWTGKVQCEFRGPPDRPTVAGVTWLQNPALPAALITAADAGDSAVFQTAEATPRSVTAYAGQIESYLSRVRDGTAALERRWGADRDAWRLLARAIAAAGGAEAMRREAGCIQAVTGMRRAPDGRELAFSGTRRVLCPFHWREEYSFAGGKTEFMLVEALDGSGHWRVFNGKMRPDDLFSPEQVADQLRMDHARNVLWHLVADEAREYRIVRGEKDGRAALTLATADFPELSLTFDAATGALASAAYVEASGKTPRTTEWRFSDFRDFGGATEPARVALWVDGKVAEDLTVQTSQRAAALAPAVFRNPYSPGKPFRGNLNGPRHALTIVNGNAVGGSVLVCIGDSSTTIALGARASQVVMLTEGEHELMIVGWSPQINIINLKEPYRFEAKPMRLSFYRDQELTIGADKLLGGSLRWNLR